jgi:hypothetical protein
MPAKKKPSPKAPSYIDTYPTNIHQGRTLSRHARRTGGSIRLTDHDVSRIEAAQASRLDRAERQARSFAVA